MSKTGIIYGVNGPVIYLKGDTGFKISEMVYVGPEKLVGEVIGLKKHMTTVQVFEETTGLKPGETVIGTGDAIRSPWSGNHHNILMVSRELWQRLHRPLENIFPVVSALTLLTPKKMGNTHYSKRRRCHRRRYGYRRDTGNRFYPSQVHGSADDHTRNCYPCRS